MTCYFLKYTKCFLELLNLVAHREFRRHKREWPRKKAPFPSTTLACCASVIGDTIRALQRTREDVVALTLKLVDIQEAEVKAFKAAALKMRIHVDLLHSEVKVNFQFLIMVSYQEA